MAEICALEGCEQPVPGTRPGQKYCCGAHRARNRDRVLAARKQLVVEGVAAGGAPSATSAPDEVGSTDELVASGRSGHDDGASSAGATTAALGNSLSAPEVDEFRQPETVHGEDGPHEPSGPHGPPRPRREAVDRRLRVGRVSLDERLAVALVAVIGVVLIVLGLTTATGTSAPTRRPAGSAQQPPAAFTPPQDQDEAVKPAVSLDQPTVAGSFPTNGSPETVAVSPDGKTAYVTITGDRPALEVLDIASGQVINDIPVPGPPYFVGVSPTGEDVYVTYYDRGQNQLVIGTMDTRLGQLSGAIPTGQRADQGGALTWLFGFAISPADPHLLYVPNMNASVVSVLDPEKGQAVAQIPVPVSPHWVALSPDGRFGYVTNHMPGQVTVIDTTQNKTVASIPIGGGMAPHSIAVSPDGKLVEEVNYDGDSLTFIDPATNTVTGTIPLGEGPQSIAFAPDGAHSYVVSEDAKTVSVISSRDRRVTGTVPAGEGASMIAVTPDGTKAVVVNKENNNFTVLNVGTPPR